MKVLVNAVAARAGGGANHLGPFIIGLADAMPDATIDVYITPDAPQRPEHERVSWHLVKIPSGMSLRRLWWDNVTIARRASSYDAVISPLNFGPIWCRPPHVLFQRNALYFDPAFLRYQSMQTRLRLAAFRWLSLLQANTATWVIVPTNAMGQFLRPRMRRTERLVVAPHTIDVDRCRQLATRPLLSKAERWADQDIRLLHIGTPSPHKALETVAETATLLAESLPKARIGVAVTCDEQDNSESVERFRSILSDNDLLHVVSWLGTIEHADVFPLYKTATVLLLPSRVESFGYPVLEALAVGCPVIASDLPAFAELTSGYITTHPIDNSTMAARHVLALLRSDSGQRVASCEASRPQATTRYQPQVIAQLLYDQVSNANSLADGRRFYDGNPS